ncbi:WxL domain-containing protein, partial [Enterococcus faecalis]|uniref:WxL domain-containing protein n=1 Tax=Enterococcus faecalis TaxID=1351 RepID=UPI003C6D2D55
TYKEFKKSREDQLIERDPSHPLSLIVTDNRGSNKQGGWHLTVQAKNPKDELAPYLIYRNEKGTETKLINGPVEIYVQEKQGETEKPLEVNITDTWKNQTGLLLSVPSKNTLSAKKYTTTLTWNLVEGP